MSGRRHSFDVFDTCLTRTVARPADLFLAQDAPGMASPHDFMRRRVEAQRQAWCRSPREEATLVEIHAELAGAMRWSGEVSRLAMAVELEMERDSLRPVPEILERVDRLHREGHSVVFLSDVYLPGGFVRDMLIRHGFWRDGDRLYVSSEEGVAKRTGRLYRRVMERERLAAGQIRHIGDNEPSDVRQARAAGWEAEGFSGTRLNRHENALLNQAGSPRLFRSRLAAASRLARLSRHGTGDSKDARVFFDSGASAIGPMLAGYVIWCLREARRLGIRRLYFVSRDGQILLRMAQAFCRVWDLDVECRYLHGSRQAWHVPALERLDAEGGDWIFDPALHLTADSVIRRVGLMPPAVADSRGAWDLPGPVQTALESGGFPISKRTRPLDSAARARLRMILLQEPMVSAIRAEAARRRAAAVGYLRQEGLFDAGGWALVDMGWGGRMQRSLRALLGHEHPITGFYFALKGACPAVSGDRLRSFLDPGWFGAYGFRWITALEAATAADHGSVTGYQPDADRGFVPMFHSLALEARNRPWIRLQQDGAVAFAEELARLVPAEAFPLEDARRVSKLVIRRFFGQPTREEAQAYGRLRAGEDQAGGRLYRLVPPIRPRHAWAAILCGRHALYRLRWPEGCFAGWLRYPRLWMALLHLRQTLGGWRKRLALSAHPKGIGLQILWVPRLQYDVDRLYLSTWREMARELEDRGHSVRVAVAGIPRSETPAGWIRLPLVPVKGLRLAGFWLAGYLTTTWQVLRGRPDVVLLDVHTAGFALPLVWRCRRILWLVDCRAPIQHTSVRRSRARQVFERALNRIAFGLAGRILDGVTVDTNYYRQLVADRHSVSPERMGVWGSGADLTGFDPERVRPVSRPVDLRERFIVFQHGELSFNRGLLETVRALAEPGLENVALVLLGQGPAREEIARTAAECGVAERLRILPPVRYGEVPAHIAGCDCAVMAYPVDEYWNCCHPIKYVEYLAMGKVVISTPLAVMREAGSDAPFLEFIPDNRPGSIAAGIRRCMDDPNRAARGRAGIAHARAHGSWGAQAERLLEFIHARQEARRRP